LKTVDDIISKRLIGKLISIYIIILSFSFPIIQSVCTILGIGSTTINTIVKLFLLILAFSILFLCNKFSDSRYLSKGAWTVIAFWLFYSCRILYDTLYVGLSYSSASVFKFYSIAFGTCLVSAIAVLKSAKYIDLKFFIRATFLMIMLSNFSILYITYKTLGTINPFDFGLRAEFYYVDESGTIKSNLNPILISLYGEMLALLSLCNVWLFRTKSREKVLYFTTFLVGMIALLLGGSRGPTLSFIGLVVLMIAYKVYYTRKTAVNVFRGFLTFGVLTFLFAFLVLPSIDFENLTVINRLVDFYDGGATKQLDNRDRAFSSAWNYFLESPFIGKRFVDRYNAYPHNILLESLMALGVLGGALFLYFNFYSFVYLFKLNNNSQYFVNISILFLVAFAISMTSGGLFVSYDYWVLLSLVLGLRGSQFNSNKSLI